MPQFYSATHKASICHWDLCFRFLHKDQIEFFIKRLLEWDHETSFEYRVEYDQEDHTPIYELQINDFPWADNLAALARILQECDYTEDEGCQE
jgi:hypothetical protein